MAEFEVILGLGSNVGDRAENLRAAISALALYLKNIRESTVLESAALLPENAPIDWDMPYLNIAIAGKTMLSPRELLSTIKEIEHKLGREKIGHWSPRNIDIDILAFGDLLLDEPDLTIPHKELLNRDFALKPLLELVPDWVHPAVVVIPAQAGILSQDSRLRGNDKPSLVGIVNVTPDSFSDGGQNFAPEKAINAVLELIEQGASVVDIGAESTRPNATPISADEEWERLAPVLERRAEFDALISVDTRHSQTAKKAIAAGVDWINDVSGFGAPDMVEAVKNADCKIVVMHSLSIPADKNVVLPEGCDVVAEVFGWALIRIKALENSGIKRERIIFDVGIGFGKIAAQSHELIKNIAKFKELGVALFVGHSRKSFLGANSVAEADQKTLEISRFLSAQGVDYLRVHNVQIHKSVLCS
jgi:2-amino-4-hydroxy-6-hydroxymethyldihydropteridine diphosphokinase/dihydropteroate synthase